MSEPSRMERYDLDARQWLPTISLSVTNDTLTAGWIDADGIYAAYGMSAYRYDLDGNNETHLADTAQSINQILGDGNLLFLNRSASLYARFTSIDKGSNSVVAAFSNYIDALGGASIAPSLNKMFGRSLGISPTDITYVNYNDDGTFSNGGDSSYHGDYPSASKTWVFPGDAKVVDSSGTVYSTAGLTYLNSFGSSITDIAFYGDEVPILLYGTTLTAYTVTILPTGSITLDHSPSRIFIDDDDVLTFTVDTTESTGLVVRFLALSELAAPTPGEPIDPTDLPYTPDSSFVDKAGILHLFSKANQSIFRWDCWAGQYTNTIPLIGVPDYAAYSEDNHTVYLAYSSGLIREIDLNDESYSEVAFAALPGKPYGLSTAGEYVFSIDASGSWDTHYTYAPDGSLVDSEDWNYYSKEYIWSDANQKMYFFRDDTSPNDLLWEQINADGVTYPSEPAGGIGSMDDSPLHTSTGFSHPIRVAPDGGIVVLGSGMIHDGTTLARQTLALTNSLSDIAWARGDIFTVRTVDSTAQFQKWSYPDCVTELEKSVDGTAHRLLALEHEAMIGVTINASGIPEFHLMDSGLDDFDPLLVYPYDPVLVEGYEGYPLMPSNVVYSLINAGASNLWWSTFAFSDLATPASGLLVPGETSAVHVAINPDNTPMPAGSYTRGVICRNQNTGRSQLRKMEVTVYPVPSAPDAPTLTLPLEATNDVTIASALEWAHANGGDDDGPWDTSSRFNVYLGTDPANMEMVAEGLTTNCFNPGLLDVDTTYYWQVVASNVVDTTASTVRSFSTWTSGPLDHFEWSQISTNQRVSIPFVAALSAVDVYGAAVVDFADDVAIEGYATPSMGDGSLLDGAVHNNTASSSVASRGLRFTVNDDITVTHLSHYWGTTVSLWTDAGELLFSAAVTNAAGSWSHTELLDPVLLEAGETYRISSHDTGVVYRRYGGVPFAFANGTVLSSCYGSDYPSSTYSSYMEMVDFRYVVGRREAMPLTPTNATEFVNGVWTGQVVVGEQADSVFLRATASDGIRSDSGFFNVDYLGHLFLELPSEVNEIDGVLPGSGLLTVSTVPSVDLVVDLSVDEGGDLSVPAQVTILAGQTNAVFDVSVLDDTLLDGSVVSLVYATSFGYRDATAEVSVSDNESATMTLSLPQTTFEGAGTITGALQLDRAPDRDVTVELISNHPGKIGGASIVVLAGETFTSFALQVIDNAEIDGIQTATIEACVQGWPIATASVFVFDNETTGIDLQLPASLWEGSASTNSGSVTLSGSTAVDVNVLLTVSDSSELVLPAYVTVPAGQSSVSFDVESPDDTETDGFQTVSILAEAPGWVPSVRYVEVNDNDLHHFDVAMPDAEIDVLVSATIGIAAKNIDGLTLEQMDGPLYLSAFGDNGDIPVDPSVSTNLSMGITNHVVAFGKVDNNVLLVADDGMGHSSTGSLFNVLGAVIVLTPSALTNTIVGVDETFERTMVISNAGNTELQFTIDVPVTTPPVTAGELVVNGDFEEGNTGFTTDYVYAPTNGISRGTYTTDTDSLVWDTSLSVAMTDHSTGAGQMLMAHGSTLADAIVWQQEIEVAAGATYDYAAWVTSFYSSFDATLEFLVNGESVGSIVPDDLVWSEFSGQWTATSSGTATLSIKSSDSSPVFLPLGSKFAIDDVSFMQEGTAIPQDDGLVAHYPFNGDAVDATGNGNDGEVMGATLTTDRFGNEDSAYSLDGNDHLLVSDNSSVFIGTNDFTYSMWVKTSSSSSQMLCQRWQSGDGPYYLRINDANGNTTFITYDSENLSLRNSQSTVDVADGSWHMITCMREGTTTLVYVDDQLVSTASGTIRSIVNKAGYLYIGVQVYNGSLINYFTGSVDDVRLYNRALSITEIEELYQEADDGLVAHYTFDGDANDESGNGYDGTVSGATQTADREGRFDSAYEFDGVDDYIEVSNSLGTEATPFAVSAWMCSTNARYQMVVSKKPSGEWNNGQWQLVASTYTGFQYADQYGNSYVNKVDADVDLNDGEWHHLCGMVDENGARLYIDGELEAEDTSVNLVSHYSAPIHIGDRAYSTGRQYFEGDIDDVQIYNRALSADEVMDLYEAAAEAEDDPESDGEGWLTVEPVSGTVAPGSNVAISVTFNAAGFAAGDITNETVTVVCNDVVSPTNEVPVSMQVVLANDLDGDGIPNWWELKFFADHILCNPALDSDGDGINNLDEFIAGMDPTNAASFFMVNSVEAVPDDGFVLYWGAVTGRVYSVWWKETMTNDFRLIESEIRLPRSSYTDRVYNAENSGFYTIDVELD
jgi:hypothetical protein